MGDAVYEAISHLRPQDEAQRGLKTEAASLMVQLAELRALVQAQAVSSVAKPLLIALIWWLVVFVVGSGLLAPYTGYTHCDLSAVSYYRVCALITILDA